MWDIEAKWTWLITSLGSCAAEMRPLFVGNRPEGRGFTGAADPHYFEVKA
jgi:hypothetical protein